MQEPTERPFNLPPHGTRPRYRRIGCRCVACIRGPVTGEIPPKLTWPFHYLDKKAQGRVAAWYDQEQISTWRKEGLDDYEADRLAIEFGFLPHEVFPGYLEAGLDAEMYP